MKKNALVIYTIVLLVLLSSFISSIGWKHYFFFPSNVFVVFCFSILVILYLISKIFFNPIKIINFHFTNIDFSVIASLLYISIRFLSSPKYNQYLSDYLFYITLFGFYIIIRLNNNIKLSYLLIIILIVGLLYSI
jgi:hypothetical protein